MWPSEWLWSSNVELTLGKCSLTSPLILFSLLLYFKHHVFPHSCCPLAAQVRFSWSDVEVKTGVPSLSNIHIWVFPTWVTKHSPSTSIFNLALRNRNCLCPPNLCFPYLSNGQSTDFLPGPCHSARRLCIFPILSLRPTWWSYRQRDTGRSAVWAFKKPPSEWRGTPFLLPLFISLLETWMWWLTQENHLKS